MANYLKTLRGPIAGQARLLHRREYGATHTMHLNDYCTLMHWPYAMVPRVHS
jgi:hypothetical protein